MIKVDNVSVYNFENAIRGARNPLKSWDKMDSFWNNNEYIIGANDMALLLKLVKAGTDHSKFMRQIFVSMDITSALYWWKEMDQYKMGTTTNSCSTMHTLGKRELTLNDFSIDDANGDFKNLLDYLNVLIRTWQETKNKEIWREIIQTLPSSFNQMRTWTGNYQNLRNIYHSRKDHKLQEWEDFCKIIEILPYSALITIESN